MLLDAMSLQVLHVMAINLGGLVNGLMLGRESLSGRARVILAINVGLQVYNTMQLIDSL